MKTIMMIFAFAFSFSLTASAQVKEKNSDQNPRAQQAYEKYRQDAPRGVSSEEHARSMGATVDSTYEAYDPILVKEQEKAGPQAAAPRVPPRAQARACPQSWHEGRVPARPHRRW
jgi:hypothetical protein